jgi:four helix bundle protein
MAKIERFEDLEVWKLSRELAKEIYKLTNTGKFSTDFRLRDRIRASSGSIMDNIAEGFERDGRKEFAQFLYIAKGSCGEVRSQLYRVLDINYITKGIFDLYYQKSVVISRSLPNFTKYLKQSDINGLKNK